MSEKPDDIELKQSILQIEKDLQELKRNKEILEEELALRRIMVEQSRNRIVNLDSECKKSEKKLNHERGFLKTLIRTLPDLVWLKDPQGVYLTCNPRFERLFGAGEADILGKTDYDFVSRDLADFFRKNDLAAIAAGRACVNEEVVTYADDGHREILETIKTPMFDSQGKLIGVLGIARDVSAFRKTEKALLESQANLVASQRIAGIGNYVFDAGNGTWRGSEVLDELFGIDHDYPHTIEGWLKLVHPEDRTMMAVILKEQVLIQRRPFNKEYRIIRLNDGTTRWLHGLGHLVPDGDGNPLHMIGTIQDITSRKEAEELRRQHALLLREAGQIAHLGGWAFDPVSLEGSWTEETCRIHDLDPSIKPTAVLGMSFYTAQSRALIETAVKDAIEHGKPYDLELELVSAKGIRKWVRTICHPVVRDGRVVLVRGSIQDITEQKRTALELQKLAEAVEQASDGILITDVDGKISYSNPAFEKISGYDIEEIINQNSRLFFNDQPNSASYKALLRTILKGWRWAGRMTGKGKDGKLFTADISVTPLKNKHNRIVNFVCAIRDITLEIKIEERLKQAQKIEAIGTLAGGIAHDFNNILSPLIGYAEILREDIGSDSPLQRYVAEILHAGSRAKNLVMQILTFSRQSEYELKDMKLQPIIIEVLQLLRSSIPKSIEIEETLDPGCGYVLADSTQVHQIVMNLATNAYQAMANTGGKLKVTLKQVYIEDNQAAYLDVVPGKFACLSVIDTGTGIEKKIIDKIFDPYFTTKEKNKGTGLGLSVVQGIVKSSHGSIRVYSEPGQGTEFDIFLPIITLNREKRAHEPVATPSGGTESILLVDDEESIALITQQMLERLGYKVAIQLSSVKALEIFKSYPKDFQLMITDMTMPNMSGDVLAQEVKKIRPDLPIIICTGFSEKINPESAASAGIKGFLLKPVARSDLAAMVRKVLDEK